MSREVYYMKQVSIRRKEVSEFGDEPGMHAQYLVVDSNLAFAGDVINSRTEIQGCGSCNAYTNERWVFKKAEDFMRTFPPNALSVRKRDGVCWRLLACLLNTQGRIQGAYIPCNTAEQAGQ